MKSRLITLIGFSMLILSACSTNESNDIPNLHDSIEIDLDEDGSTDYEIYYSRFDIEPIGEDAYFGIAGRIKPIGKNLILLKEDMEPLFLKDLEEVEENVALPLFWRNPLLRTIVLISPNGAGGEWPEKWDIQSDAKQSSYYIGLKLIDDSEFQLGWIEIEIDIINGEVSIADRGLL